LLLILLARSSEKDHDRVAVLAEADAISGTEVDSDLPCELVVAPGELRRRASADAGPPAAPRFDTG
jgi:hypothetical protein